MILLMIFVLLCLIAFILSARGTVAFLRDSALMQGFLMGCFSLMMFLLMLGTIRQVWIMRTAL